MGEGAAEKAAELGSLTRVPLRWGQGRERASHNRGAHYLHRPVLSACEDVHRPVRRPQRETHFGNPRATGVEGSGRHSLLAARSPHCPLLGHGGLGRDKCSLWASLAPSPHTLPRKTDPLPSCKPQGLWWARPQGGRGGPIAWTLRGHQPPSAKSECQVTGVTWVGGEPGLSFHCLGPRTHRGYLWLRPPWVRKWTSSLQPLGLWVGMALCGSDNTLDSRVTWPRSNLSSGCLGF